MLASDARAGLPTGDRLLLLLPVENKRVWQTELDAGLGTQPCSRTAVELADDDRHLLMSMLVERTIQGVQCEGDDRSEGGLLEVKTTAGSPPLERRRPLCAQQVGLPETDVVFHDGRPVAKRKSGLGASKILLLRVPGYPCCRGRLRRALRWLRIKHS